MASTTHRRARGTTVLLAVPLGIVLSCVLVWDASYATFSATTTAPANRWDAGTVTLGHDAEGIPLNVEDLRPGMRTTACVTVTYTGSLAAEVRLYTVDDSGALPDHLDLEVDQGTMPTSTSGGDCTGFDADADVVRHDGTLAQFQADHTGHDDGFGTWAPTGPEQTRTYRFSYEVQATNDAEGKTATTTLIWEAQNT